VEISSPKSWNTSVPFKKLPKLHKQSPKKQKFAQSDQPGTDVMIFKIFLPKKLRKNWRF
jgi:hypothetical protein